MKHLSRTFLDIARAVILLLVLGVGATTLSARYSTATVSTPVWTAAPANAPANNADAPINVSVNAQRKLGSLILGTTAAIDFTNPIVNLDVFGLASTTFLSTGYLLVSNGFTLANGTQGAGKVLTSDASGVASWQTSTGTGVPAGAIVMFDAACPTGWTRFADLDGRVARGSSTYGYTGGADTHSHPRSGTGGGRTNAGYGSSSSWPPFLDVIWCKKS